MNHLLPSLIITDPRCASSALQHCLVASIATHNAITAAARADSTQEVAFDARVTDDDYW